MELINGELRIIEKNKTWELVDKPENKKVIPDGSVNKLKVRLVVKWHA